MARAGLRHEESVACDPFKPKEGQLKTTWPWAKIQIVPVNIPIQPLKKVLKWVVHLAQNGTIGVDPQPY